MERKVGEIIKYGRTVLQVVEDPSCSGCYFNKNNGMQCRVIYKIDNDLGPCSSMRRLDGKSVKFKKL